MLDTGLWTVITGAIPGVGLGGMAVWQFYKKWRETFPGSESWEQRETEALDRRRAQLDSRTDAISDRQERYVKQVEQERDDLRYDRDRGWNLARWWEATAHDLRHDLVNALLAAKSEHTVPRLPGLEEPELKTDKPS